MLLEFSGTLKENDLRAGITRQMYPAFIFGFVMLALGILALALSLLSTGENSASPISSLFPIAMGLVLVSLPRFTARRQFKSNKLISMPITGSVSSEGVSISNEVGSANIKWEHFHKYVISPKLVLLFQSSAVFQIFPSSFFQNEADWSSFNALVKSKVQRKRNKMLISIIIWLAVILLLLIAFRNLPHA